MITTYRAKRRQKVGPGAWRQPGELLPELHVARTAYSSLVTGFAAEVQIEAEEFVREIRELGLDAELEARVLDSVGLVPTDPDEGEPEVLESTVDTTKHGTTTLVPPDKDVEHRIGGPTQPTRRPPATKRAARKRAPKASPAARPEETLLPVGTADGEPDLTLRTLD